MGLAKTWSINRIEPLSGDPLLSGFDCSTTTQLKFHLKFSIEQLNWPPDRGLRHRHRRPARQRAPHLRRQQGLLRPKEGPQVRWNGGEPFTLFCTVWPWWFDLTFCSPKVWFIIRVVVQLQRLNKREMTSIDLWQFIVQICPKLSSAALVPLFQPKSTESVNFLGLEVFLAPSIARNQPRTPKNWGTQ